jgi:hypothetical protein
VSVNRNIDDRRGKVEVRWRVTKEDDAEGSSNELVSVAAVYC